MKFELLLSASSNKTEGRGRRRRWEGILSNVQRRYTETDSDSVRADLEAYMVVAECPDCDGRRLKPESLAVTLHGRDIGAFTEASAAGALEFAESIPVRENGKPGARSGDRRPHPQGSA